MTLNFSLVLQGFTTLLWDCPDSAFRWLCPSPRSLDISVTHSSYIHFINYDLTWGLLYSKFNIFIWCNFSTFVIFIILNLCNLYSFIYVALWNFAYFSSIKLSTFSIKVWYPVLFSTTFCIFTLLFIYYLTLNSSLVYLPSLFIQQIPSRGVSDTADTVE